MRDFTDALSELRVRVENARAYLGIDEARTQLTELEAQASSPGLWDDPDRARQVTSKLSQVKDDLDTFDALEGRCSDVETLHALARAEGDESFESQIQAG